MPEQSQLPKGWEKEKLGDFVASQKGKKPKVLSPDRTKETPHAYVNIKAFEQGVVDEYADAQKSVFCDEGDLLIVWDGSRSGLVGRAIKGVVGSTICKLDFPGMFNPYSYYFLESKYQQVNTRAKGTGTPHVDPDLLWNFEFPIPPYNEQQRIVAKIEELFSQLDDGVAALQKAQQQLKLYRQSVLKAAFEGRLTADWRKQQTSLPSADELMAQIKEERQANYEQQVSDWQQAVADWEAGGKAGKKPRKPAKPKELPPLTPDELADLPDLPDGWGWVRLIETGTWSGGGTPSKRIAAYWTDGTIPWVSPKDMKGDLINTSEDQITKIAVEESSTQEIPPKSLLFVVRSGILRRTLPTGYTDRVVTINQDLQALTPVGFFAIKYCFYWSQAFNDTIRRSCAKDGTTVESIETNSLKLFCMAVCSNTEQQQIVAAIESRLSVADKMQQAIEESLEKAKALRQSILKKAFEGRLVPQDPTDEPASELLKRIQQQEIVSIKNTNNV